MNQLEHCLTMQSIIFNLVHGLVISNGLFVKPFTFVYFCQLNISQFSQNLTTKRRFLYSNFFIFPY